MTDEIWQRDEPASPCIKVCVIHPEARLCVGCLRTIDEITVWSRLTEPDRQAIMATLSARAPLIRQRRGGRAGALSRRAQD